MMDKTQLDAAIQRVSNSEAYGLPARLAPELKLLDTAVALRLITWAEVARRLDVSPNTLHPAKKAAAKILKKWAEQGVDPNAFNTQEKAIETEVKPEQKSDVTKVRNDSSTSEDESKEGSLMDFLNQSKKQNS